METRNLEIFLDNTNEHQRRNTTNPIPWVEAGQRISGILCIYSPETPASKLQQPHAANIEISIQSTYDCRCVVEWLDGDGFRHERSQVEPEIYNTVNLQCNSHVRTLTEAEKFAPDSHSLWIPFGFDLPRDMAQSTPPLQDSRKQAADPNLVAGYIKHKLMIKTTIPGFKIMTEWSARDLLVLRARPDFNLRNQPMLHSVDSLPDVRMELAPDSFAYMEGDIVSVTARIELLSETIISDAKLGLVVKCDTVQFRFHDKQRSYTGTNTVQDFKSRYGEACFGEAKTESISTMHKILEVKLRGLNLRPGQIHSRNLCLGSIPDMLEYASTAFQHGKHQRNIRYEISLELEKPAALHGIKADVGIEIYPRCPSASRQILASMNPADVRPTTYVGLYRQKLVVTVVRAEGLPRMDGLVGKADPYCTLLLSNTYFRNTKVLKNTLNPEWRESFTIYVSEHDQNRGMSLQLECFDDDIGSKDDLIGVAEATLSSSSMPQQLKLELTRPGRRSGKVEKTGTVSIEYRWE